MGRIDEVYKTLNDISHEQGLSASDLASAMKLDRANVSSDLNKLCEMGKVIKIKGKPVLFLPKKLQERESALNEFAKKNESLHSAVEQAKAAILYPPKGMNILILGETGVGKSMFASLIHKYSIEMDIKKNDAPFIIFNCADYANNPQLLMAQLYGSKKGAYTGADTDKAGLIEKADGGILFLDEIHRLPPEGQEMFFTFMDKGIYRRLGDTESEKTADVLIISATTENPESFLLKTFTRRIPMIIRIPNLNERSLEERYNIISNFMKEESSRLGKEIKVSANTMKSLLSYKCHNNVGQLKTDIQLLCAKAYADYVVNNKKDIIIRHIDIPEYIKDGLYTGIKDRKNWNKLIGVYNQYSIFNSNEEETNFENVENNEGIYELINLRVAELQSKGIVGPELDMTMEKDIEDYFTSYIHEVSKSTDMSKLESIIEPGVINLVKYLITLAEERLGRNFSSKVQYGMVVHISNSIARVKKSGKISNPNLNSIRIQYRAEFNIALDFLKIIERTYDLSMPIDEAGFLTLFLVYDDKYLHLKTQEVQIIIIAHGVSTATSMADTVNELLGVNHAKGINAPLEEKPKNILAKLKNYIKIEKINSDILFLVDMGSFTTFGAEIEKAFGIKTKTIPLVSTLHVLESTRKATMGYDLDYIYNETLNVSDLMINNSKMLKVDNLKYEKLAVITVCTTGEGSAITIKNFLNTNLNYDHDILEIIPLNLIGKQNIYSKIRDIENKYTVVAMISSFDIDTTIPKFDLEQVLNTQEIIELQKLIDLEITYIKIGDVFKEQLSNVDGKEVLIDVKNFNKIVQKKLNIKFNTSILIGISSHMCCMIDRLKGKVKIDEFEGKDKYIKENYEKYITIKENCIFLNKKYEINISDNEICLIMEFFDKKKWNL